MTDEELSIMEDRLETVPSGPWKWSEDGLDWGVYAPGFDPPIISCHEWSPGLEVDSIAVASFTAHARVDMPALIEEVRRLRDENADLKSRIKDCLETAGNRYHEWGDRAVSAFRCLDRSIYVDPRDE